MLGNSQHTPTHFASLFVRLLRCRKFLLMEDKQTSCAIWVVYLLRLTLVNTQKKRMQFLNNLY